MQYSNELYHYGVLGMKWGVRRYQNYDGSYTQKGLRRYRKAEERYDNATARLKEAKRNNNRTEMSKARAERSNAKNEMTKAYKKLKTDRMADEGKKLTAEGRTIGDNIYRNRRINKALAIVGTMASSAGSKARTARTAALCYTLGDITEAAAIASTVKNYSDNKKIRAYYHHYS